MKLEIVGGSGGGERQRGRQLQRKRFGYGERQRGRWSLIGIEEVRDRLIKIQIDRGRLRKEGVERSRERGERKE